MSNDLSKTEALIAQMIAKAEATTFPAEAEMFMARAEQLMLKHGIDRANLEAKATGAAKPEIVQTHITLKNGHGYAQAQAAIIHQLASEFSVRTFKSTGYNTETVWMVGHKSDVESLTQLVTSLVEQARKQALAWWKSEGKARMSWATDNDAYLARREFIFSFARGAASRLAEIKNQVVAEAETGTALVLVERIEKVDSWISDNMQVGKARASQRRSGGIAARSAGRAAGRESVNPKAVR